MAVEFGILGVIEARVDGRLVDLGHARQRLLLAALLVDHNHEVTVDQIVERVWGDRPVQRGTLHSYLSRLRQTLTATDGVRITRRPAGYVITGDAQAVDLHRFRHRVAQARRTSDDEHAAALLEQALGLWRGEALATVDTPWANTLRETLRHERRAAELDAADIGLRLNRHTELLPGLRDRTHDHPLDERLAGQLILALHRCGRTAEALECYTSTRRRLAEELGIDPGPPLKRLHQQILTGDPALTPRTGPTVITRSAPATVPAPVPRQLPAPPALFTGRTRELAALSAALDQHADPGGTVVISAIGGTGGIGKTYLALRWAHDHTERFPDGQLYIDLRGFDPSGESVPPSVAIRGFLGALGAQPSAVPVNPDAQTALYRSLVADKRMLIVLDNARDTAQVTPLLPGSPSCTVLVTSRRQLSGLRTAQGARPLTLGTLSEAEARQLLVRHLGEARIAAEPDAVTAILEHCAGLPLALSIIAARAAAYPDFPLTHLAAELAESATRLDALDAGDLAADLRAVFSASYQALEPEAARAFALLGLAPGPDISLPAAAGLTSCTPARARTLLRTLETAHLLRQHIPGRYQLHDLVRLYAAERGQRDLDEPDRTTALRRVLAFYLHTAHRADRLVEPHPAMPVELDPPALGCLHQPLADQKEALAWFVAEYPCLLAAQQLAADHHWHTPAWQLPCTLDAFQLYHGRHRDRLPMWRAALAATQHLTDPALQARAHVGLGWACGREGQHAEGGGHLSRALAVFEQTGHLRGQACAHWGLASSWSQQGDAERALPHAEHALQLYRRLGDPALEATMLNNAGWIHAQLGHYEQARAHCTQSRDLARRLGDDRCEAGALDSLGYIAHHTGRHTQALDHYHQALTLFRKANTPHDEAGSLEDLGEIYRALGQHTQARHAWQQALELYRAQHRATDATRVQEQLDASDQAQTQTDAAKG
ncbi:BTAD domain-containing putative transcriptional regulator [Streptomyces sp. 8N616]|uniref:BTAD domain-containing putative transcriptional regulator n=1 Tax=Streptomyces sp. 8N616 TaxID=3457414 RepID=UPI003FD08DF6